MAAALFRVVQQLLPEARIRKTDKPPFVHWYLTTKDAENLLQKKERQQQGTVTITFTPEEIKEMLCKYYDLPAMIAEEFAAVRKAIEFLKPPCSPDTIELVRNEIQCHMQRAVELATWKRFLHDALYKLEREERILLQYRLMGPREPELRKGFRPLSWKSLGPLTEYSSVSQAMAVTKKAIKRLSEFPVIPVIFPSAHD